MMGKPTILLQFDAEMSAMVIRNSLYEVYTQRSSVAMYSAVESKTSGWISCKVSNKQESYQAKHFLTVQSKYEVLD